ncbi:hypothetical protein KY290_003523 [Solanum tuberosum]|uniref:Uncharacterized protein n=1 Tax=Solanum tuberosum TaxID=4113 RepID=A0ABQ7WT73_SOLTU|nr:hypothetical protein KY284_003658 [Solanum tuberosum]KAH0732664.1 hypothetical protein KY289_003852 [Solanum tuberosum]KAH0767634.1 hypothetical protein KY285_003505 [Solanum tuberosum]KAH0783925.1 hypothetical protein KY290_003523 [Solanum tuberosum]
MGVAANRSTPLLSIYWWAHAQTLRRCIDSGKTPANRHLDIDISSSGGAR